MTETVNRQGLADHCGVSLPTINAWVRKGCPVKERGGKGKPWEFDVGAVDAWRYQHIVDRGLQPSRDVEAALAKMMVVHALILTEMAAELRLPIPVIYALEMMVSTELSAACMHMVLGRRSFRFDDLQDHYWEAFKVDWHRLASGMGTGFDEEACEAFLEDQEWSKEVAPKRQPRLWRPTPL